LKYKKKSFSVVLIAKLQERRDLAGGPLIK